MTVELTSGTFAPHVGEAFEVAPAGGAESFQAVLSSCEEHGGAGRVAGRVPFSLVFHSADRERYWPQQIFTLRHPDLGELALFMVPLGPDDRGMQYEAVVN